MTSYFMNQFLNGKDEYSDPTDRIMKRQRRESVSSNDSCKDTDECSSVRSFSPQTQDEYFPCRPMTRTKSISTCLSDGSISLSTYSIISDVAIGNALSNTEIRPFKSRLMTSWGWFVPIDK